MPRLTRVRLCVKGAQFFKVFLPNSRSDHLLIPPYFLDYFKRTLKEKVILQNIEGKIWYVDVEEALDGFFLKKGWQSFVDYHGLKFGEFLVFTYIGSYSFEVKVFGISASKKESFEPENIATRVKPKEDDQEMQSRIFKESENTKKILPNGASFTWTNRAEKSHLLRIPDEVIKKHKLKFDQEVILRNEKGKEWPVRVYARADGVKFLGMGLYAFVVGNKVGTKDSCKFTFGTGRLCKTIYVQVKRK